MQCWTALLHIFLFFIFIHQLVAHRPQLRVVLAVSPLKDSMTCQGVQQGFNPGNPVNLWLLMPKLQSLWYHKQFQRKEEPINYCIDKDGKLRQKAGVGKSEFIHWN